MDCRVNWIEIIFLVDIVQDSYSSHRITGSLNPAPDLYLSAERGQFRDFRSRYKDLVGGLPGPCSGFPHTFLIRQYAHVLSLTLNLRIVSLHATACKHQQQ